MAGGANRVSLIDAQHNYLSFSASEKRRLPNVRPPYHNEHKDPLWRTIDEAKDHFEKFIPGFDYGATYPHDPTSLYYWLQTYWRKGAS